MHMFCFFFFFHDPATTEIYTLSLHDALPICPVSEMSNSIYALILAGGSGERFWPLSRRNRPKQLLRLVSKRTRSEEHTSELQSHSDLVCRLLLEKKKRKKKNELQQKLIEN